MRPLWLLLIFAFLLYPAVSFCQGIVISEIMYDPLQDDNYNEWIEVFNPSSEAISFENWTLCNVKILSGFKNFSDGLLHENLTYEIPAGVYAIITDGGSSGTQAYDNFSVYGMPFHVNSTSMCGGLNDNGDTVNISYDNYTLSIDYNSTLGGKHNNKTLCFYGGVFQECLPTPGYRNEIENISNYNNKVQFNVSTPGQVLLNRFVPLFNISSDNCSFVRNLSYNLTNSTYFYRNAENISCGHYGNMSFANPGILDLCWNMPDYNLSNCTSISVIEPANETCNISLTINAPMFANLSESFEYYIDLKDPLCNSHDIEVEYWIEDLFGNIIRSKSIARESFACNIKDDRSFTPKDSGTTYVIFAGIEACSLVAQKTVSVLGIPVSRQNNSVINISGFDNYKSFGSILYVDLNIYRGNSTKYAIDIWSENGVKSSYVSTIHANEKFTNYSFHIPLQLKLNCDNSISGGMHQIIAEGLDAIDIKNVTISGLSGMCLQPVSSTSTGSSSSGSSSSSSGSSGSFSSQVQNISIDFDAPESVETGSALEIHASLTSSFSQMKNISVYSYVYRGSYLANEGGWMPNDKGLILNSSKTAVASLNNKIKNDSEEGSFILKVRVKDLITNKTYDKTSDILIYKNYTSKIMENVSKISADPEKNTSSPGLEPSKTRQVVAASSPLTGFIAAKNDQSPNKLIQVLLKLNIAALRKFLTGSYV
jgi:hypothetical protein